MRTAAIAFVAFIFCCGIALADEGTETGYLVQPPIFIDNEPDIPLTGMGLIVPSKGRILPDFDVLDVRSDEFRKDDVEVQPALDVKIRTIRLGALYGVSDDWAAAVSIPWDRIKVSGAIGGLPASGVNQGVGDITFAAKKLLWSGPRGEALVATAGLEVPTGDDDDLFAEDNAVTNAYYATFPRRMPISWQPGSGTVDGFLSLAYGRRWNRFAYMGLIAGKLHSSGDEDVKIGNIVALAVTGTYGFSKRFAGALGFLLRSQADDDYPNAPAPGVDAPALAGTTEHGTTLYFDTSLRYNALRKLSIGLGIRIPIVKPDDGLVPDTRVFVIVYPTF